MQEIHNGRISTDGSAKIITDSSYEEEVEGKEKNRTEKRRKERSRKKRKDTPTAEGLRLKYRMFYSSDMYVVCSERKSGSRILFC
jgi:hypothetical protein